jgi:phosphoglycolate phosphatase-like HAD superfamily hydrolase
VSREAAGGKIIFDMDGVIIKEDCYWDAAALTVWELLFSERYLGLEPSPDLPEFKTGVSAEEIASIRRIILQEGRVTAFFKRRAINSNLDLAFLVFIYQLMSLLRDLERSRPPGDATAREAALLAGGGTFPGNLQRLSRLLKPIYASRGALQFDAVLRERTGSIRGEELLAYFFTGLTGEQGRAGGRALVAASPLWSGVRDVFQEWYLGEEKFRENYGREPSVSGKEGLLHLAAHLLPSEEIGQTLRRLKEQGWILGIATGRSWPELSPHLEAMGIRNYFERASIVTRDQVQKAEESLQKIRAGISLGKPHPYSFLKAYWGTLYNDEELVFSTPPQPPPGKCWAVGDSLADLLSARGMGASFIGVLTGPLGAAAGNLFRREGARVVLPDMTHIPGYLGNL